MRVVVVNNHYIVFTMRATLIGFKIVHVWKEAANAYLSLFQFVCLFFFPDPEFMAQRGSKGANESDITSPDVGQKLCFDDETLKGKVTATKTITKIFISAFNMSKADIFFLFSYDPRIKPNTSLFESLCLEK